MTAADALEFLDGYRRHFDPPVRTGVTVESVCRTADGFDVRADHGRWRCDAVVAATGASSNPRVPALATEMPRHIDQLTALEYRRPAQLAEAGRVLVVGASASGVQIADELRRAGREVTISVGEHVRLPRSYRGRDIYWWLDRIGQLDERYDEVDDIERARRHASVQLVGNDDRRDLDLNALHAGGVQIVGRFMAIRGATGAVLGGAREPGGERRPQTGAAAPPHRRVRERPRVGGRGGPGDGRVADARRGPGHRTGSGGDSRR